jgi:phosphohistidine phosphatase
MRRLMLLRHAKSDWSEAGTGDHERPLNRRGQETAPKIGAYLAHANLTPDLVICSTAKRTRQTFNLVASAFSKSPPAIFEDRLYLTDRATILNLIRATPRNVHSLLLIGHNPGLHETALALISAGDADLRDRLREKFPTAALAVIELAIDDWAAIRPHIGRLDRFITPRLLADAD